MAAFFARDHAIQVIQAKGIIEDTGGKLERDPMLGDIGAILTLVPFKDHRIYSIAVYTDTRRPKLGQWLTPAPQGFGALP
ncbi:MAG TPA: hypothetical protein VIY49_07770 [Bryobacteraceae bacterium]